MRDQSIAEKSVYAPPEANLIREVKGGEEEQILMGLKWQSTWLLVLLGLITMGIYVAHYNLKQTNRLNKYLEEEKRISLILPYVFLFFAYMGLVFLLLPFVVEATLIQGLAEFFSNIAWGVVWVVWAFIFRGRFHHLFDSQAGEEKWLHGFWTFFFTSYYLNYKINILNKEYGQE